ARQTAGPQTDSPVAPAPGGRHAAAPAPALRAKGINDEATPPLTYTGPSEDGSAAVQRRDNGDGAAAGTTRKERREAARRAAKPRRG
ncbi:MAG: hypothetical protein WBB07_05245, partial [Mycobacterium sp.]